jgi:hypothetical protein
MSVTYIICDAGAFCRSAVDARDAAVLPKSDAAAFEKSADDAEWRHGGSDATFNFLMPRLLLVALMTLSVGMAAVTLLLTF